MVFQATFVCYGFFGSSVAASIISIWMGPRMGILLMRCIDVCMNPAIVSPTMGTWPILFMEPTIMFPDICMNRGGSEGVDDI